ncbi:MAG: FAD-dependent oxidoreductase [Actinobacteria bacterium]|nr:FAD-dependent oxidoreductase [Actinomycetota bacterium]
MVSTRTDVCIVGGGLAGLACARLLARQGLGVTLLEATDDVGGRVRTDAVDGFLLDRGYQVVLTQLPELHHQLDIAALDLQCYEPGAVVRVHGRFHRIDDPRRHPARALATATAPIGTVADDLRLLGLVVDLMRTNPRELLRRPDTSTLEALRSRGFSEQMIQRFWRPLFAGIQLDPDLEVSSRRFELILAMLAEGAAAHPAAGVQAIPRLLAAAIPAGVIECNAPVARIDGTTAHLADGRAVEARALVVATEGPAAARLLGIADPGSRAESCVYFAADEAPLPHRMIVLNGSRTGPINNLAVVSNVAPSYAPAGRALVAAVTPGPLVGETAELEAATRRQLRGWFGRVVDGWDHLRTYRIAHAHPDQRPGFSPKRRVRLGDGVYVCGDHRDTASTQGALYSGRRTASAVWSDLQGRRPVDVA